MLSNISKAELAELTRKMRATASLPKNALAKRNTLVVVTQSPIYQDEQTTLGLVFKRKRPATNLPTEHSRFDGGASHNEVLTIPECDVESSREKSLWDPDFDIPALLPV